MGLNKQGRFCADWINGKFGLSHCYFNLYICFGCWPICSETLWPEETQQALNYASSSRTLSHSSLYIAPLYLNYETFCCAAQLLMKIEHFLPSPSRLALLFPYTSDWGILMSETKANLGDFLCASVIWFCPEAALLRSLLSGWPEPWKSDFPFSPLPFSCGHVWMRWVCSYCGVI